MGPSEQREDLKIKYCRVELIMCPPKMFTPAPTQMIMIFSADNDDSGYSLFPRVLIPATRKWSPTPLGTSGTF